MPTQPPDTGRGTDSSETIRDQFERGVRDFSLLFTRWMDTNGWSHPVMVGLAAGCLKLPSNKGWLHSSQISGFRHGTLLSPGPRTFMAIERLNYYLHRYATKQLLLPGSSSSNAYRDPFVITEDGEPPALGWWLEVFCGVRTPLDIDLRRRFFSAADAAYFSENWAKMLRRLLITGGHDVIDELDALVRAHYPTREPLRVDRLTAVVHGRVTWSPDALLQELPALTALTAALGGPTTEDELLRAVLDRA